MKRSVVLLTLLYYSLFSNPKLYSQIPTLNKEWEVVLGSEAKEQFDRVGFMVTDHLGFIYLATNSPSNAISGNKTDPSCSIADSISTLDIWLIKLDSNGNIIWNRSIGGLDGESVNKILMAPSNSKIVLLGASNSEVSCEKSQNRYDPNRDTWTIELNLDSNVIWDKRYGSIGKDQIYTGAISNNGNIILAGEAEIFTPNLDVTDTNVGFLEDIWLLKLDSLGTKLWDQKYGSTLSDYAYSIVPLSDEQFLIVASTPGQKSGDLSDSSFSAMFDSTYYKLDNWILKIDENGNKIWDNRYGCLMADDAPSGAALLNSDGNVVIGAHLGLSSLQGYFYPCNDGVADTTPRGGWDAWIYKIDTADGHIISERRFGGDRNEVIKQIRQTSDKGYLLACTSNSNASFEKSENRIGTNGQNLNNYDIWLVRMDSAFNIIWDKTIGTEWYDRDPDIIVLSDSSFILACPVELGNNFDVGLPIFDTLVTQWQGNKGDIWVSKWYIPNPAQVQEMSLASFNLHPNPVTDILYITLQNAKNKTYHLHVQDMQGRMVVQRQLTITNSNTSVQESHDCRNSIYEGNIEGGSKEVVKL
ncbi:MAG: hypothetical protein IPO27_10245 [Bacteroidetes bacterium]|nr:hypothetical protein [Bacteroidota bacterium]